MLTTLIQRHRVKPHPKFTGKLFERFKEMYSQAKGVLTLTWVAAEFLHPVNGVLI